jgi:hypothetical protein
VGIQPARASTAFAMANRCFLNPEKSEREPMIYEMRIYHCAPGRLPALLSRFDSVTLKLWEKYGIRQVGFWTTLVGESNQMLTYLLQWENMAEREQKWNAFSSDADWLAKRAASEAEGVIVHRIENSLLAPTAFSALK